ncbi:recombinase family protein [Streptomyces sp900105245]|uniref:Recombinase family protein n=1 Tax=Streptomyces sp. 900105245 TaxID=3154379 RepID=A0ABV1UEI4_9ACTN
MNTRLDRLSRSVLHLVTLGADLCERGIGLHVIEQGIDTSTMEGRAMFGMLSVLAELQRQLIVANAMDGLASAGARGRVGGRRPRLTSDQPALAQQLYDAREKTVQQIADLFGVLHGVRAPRQDQDRPTPAEEERDCETLTATLRLVPEPGLSDPEGWMRPSSLLTRLVRHPSQVGHRGTGSASSAETCPLHPASACPGLEPGRYDSDFSGSFEKFAGDVNASGGGRSVEGWSGAAPSCWLRGFG